MEQATKTYYAAPEIDPAAIDGLRLRLRGELILKSDEKYDEIRKVYNAMIDRHPLMIARCRDAADVIASVNFARERDMPVSIRGGGHNVAGLAVADDIFMIDLSEMKGIWVDPANRRARVQGGCVLGDYDHATHAFGLASPGGIVSTTGVAGLTLGGGFGYLTRKYGLACDNLISADVVTADGQFLKASESENEDLFWALRGGGGNFGVVTSFEFQLHPVSMIYGGPVFYPIEKTVEVMRFYWDFIREIPEEASAYFGVHMLPPAPFIPENLHGMKTCMIFPSYIGDEDEGKKLFEPVREISQPVVDMLMPMPYPAIQQIFDAILTPGLHHYWKGDFFNEISEESMEIHMKYGAQIPNFRSGMHLYPLNGAVHNKRNSDTAFSHRDANFSMALVAVSDNPAEMPGATEWAKSYWSELHPYSAGAANVNFLMDEGQERIRATYRDNYERLTRIKKKYDPTNMFRINQNIRPAE